MMRTTQAPSAEKRPGHVGRRLALSFSVAAVVLVAAFSISCRAADDARPGSSQNEVRLDIVTVGAVGAHVDTPLPLLIAIHGLGDTPEAFCDFMKAGISVPARIVCPRAPNEYGRGFSWFPPMSALTTADRLADALREAGTLVAELSAVLAQDPNLLGEPVLTGYSQGGMTSFSLATSDARLFGAVVPIAGMLPEPLRSEIRAGEAIPLYAFHGEADELVPFAEAERTIKAFEREWPEVEFSSYEGVAHRLSNKMREDLFARLDLLLGVQSGAQ